MADTPPTGPARPDTATPDAEDAAPSGTSDAAGAAPDRTNDAARPARGDAPPAGEAAPRVQPAGASPAPAPDADDAAARRRNIENITPLAPLQEGILFHSLTAPPEAGVYMPQIAFHLSGPIDAPRLRRAWEAVLARHSALRSAIHWEERDEPFQVVYRSLPLPWEEFDWRGEDGAARLAALFAANRARPFDLRRPPLLRVQLARLADDRHVLLRCHHHIILDGWSQARMLEDVMAVYRGLPLPPARPYAEYIRWLKRQDRAGALAFWRGHLAGAQPTLAFAQGDEGERTGAPGGQGDEDGNLEGGRTGSGGGLNGAREGDRTEGNPAGGPDRGAHGFARRDWPFPPALSAHVGAFCAAQGVTLNTLLQGILGLTLAERLGRGDVVFGGATAGRPASLPGAAEMVGLFLNALPVRVRLEAGAPVGRWLQSLQRGQAATMEHEHVALREIQGPGGTLFDCLLVVENYPVTAGAGAGAIRLDRIEFDEWTHFPLTLLVAPASAGMKLILRHDRAALPAAALERLLARYVALLTRVVEAPETPVGDLVPLPDAPAGDGTDGGLPAAGGPAGPAATTGPAALLRRAPQGASELLVAGIWAEVLKVPPPDAGANFFALGGHSLLAARVATRLRRDTGLEIALRAVFDHPVLADLAAHLDRLAAADRPAEGETVVEF